MSDAPKCDKIEQNSQLMKARCRLYTYAAFYGHIALSMTWVESQMEWVENPDARTMAVKICSDGNIVLYFNPEWTEKQTVEVLYGAIEHTINHLVYLHTIRTNMREPEPWHMACDMVVNGYKSKPHIGHNKNNVLTLPDQNMIFVPTEWKDTESADWYYEQLNKEFEKEQKKNSKPGKQPDEEDGDEGEGNPGEGEEDSEGNGKPSDKQGKGGGTPDSKSREQKIGKYKGNSIDDHSTWQKSEVSQDEARQIVNSMVSDAVQKSQGTVPGHLKEAIEALGKAKVNWKALLRQYIARNCGNRRKTYSRTERRTQAFGSKGISHHAASNICVVVDTSGSVSPKELEAFFSEIEGTLKFAKVTVVEFDAGPCGDFKYRKGDWKKIGVSGRGGTNMAAAMDYAVATHQAECYILLTDGFTPWPAPGSYPWICVISQSEHNAPSPPWGHVIRLELD